MAAVIAPWCWMVQLRWSFSKTMTGGLLFGSNSPARLAIASTMPALSVEALPLATTGKMDTFLFKQFTGNCQKKPSTCVFWQLSWVCWNMRHFFQKIFIPSTGLSPIEVEKWLTNISKLITNLNSSVSDKLLKNVNQHKIDQLYCINRN